MQQDFQNSTYRTLLGQKYGKGFTEIEIIQFLKQILPQLMQLHNSGQAHGAISLDTLVLVDNFPRFLIVSANQIVNNQQIAKDISDLGRVCIELMTAKPFEIVGTNWDDFCVVSDRTLAIINSMLQNFQTASDILLALDPSFAQTVMPVGQSFSQSKPTNQNQIYWIIPGAIVLGLLLGFGFWRFGFNSTANNTANISNNSNQPQQPRTSETANPVVENTPPPVVNTPVPPPPPVREVLDVDAARLVIQNLYGYLSVRDWASTKSLFSPQLASQFNPNFFNQFNRVTIENLYITSKTDTSVSFIGTNTYFYPDGAIQTEERSFTVILANNRPLISSSEFIRVVKSR